MPAGTSIRVEGGIPNVTMPSFDKSFRPGKVKEIMAEVLKSRLEGLEYDADNCSTWCREISDEVKQRLKLLGMEVQVGGAGGHRRAEGRRRPDGVPVFLGPENR